MKIIIPMAGMGKRMRPHTLTVPKPLIPIAGKPIVTRLVEDLAKVCAEPIEEVAFVIGRFGEETENRLLQTAASIGAKGSIYYQDEALGTAHAVHMAAASLSGKVMVAFADTLFKANFKLDSSKDGIIWVHKVARPEQFGVVKMENEVITDFIEKPQTFVSDLAIIGIYYFKDGDLLRNEIKHLIDNNITVKGEYQLTDVLENMKLKGTKFYPGKVDEWLDCGNKKATVETNARYLEYLAPDQLIEEGSVQINSVIIPPVYLAPGSRIENSVVGPHVSVGKNTVIVKSIISNTIIQENTGIENAHLTGSMIGNNAAYSNRPDDVSVGDYNVISKND